MKEQHWSRTASSNPTPLAPSPQPLPPLLNFDDTHIVIRERGYAEIMDLALKVIRLHLGPLVMAGLVGVLPWAMLNLFMLRQMATDWDVWDNPSGFIYFVLMVVAVQTPLATAPITLYLGQVTFLDRIDGRRMLRDFSQSLPQMLLHALLRAVLAVTFIGLMLPYGFRPYLSELILLERNPMFPGKNNQMTTRRRSRNLHGNSGGDLFGNWMASMAIGALLITALVGGLSAGVSQLAGYEASMEQAVLVLYPACLWVVMGFFAVVRFLAYLDLRIRREGWEVELKMRSEAARLAKGMVG